MVCQSTASFSWESTLRCKSEIGVTTTAILTVTPVSNGKGTVMSVVGALNAYAYQIHYQTTSTTTSRSVGGSQALCVGSHVLLSLKLKLTKDPSFAHVVATNNSRSIHVSTHAYQSLRNEHSDTFVNGTRKQSVHGSHCWNCSRFSYRRHFALCTGRGRLFAVPEKDKAEGKPTVSTRN